MPDNSTVATQTLKAEPGKAVTLPAGEITANAEFTRDGQDLCLTSNGHMVRIEGYFAQDPAPDVVSADGSARFTPQLVNSFLPPQHPGEYAQAQNASATDATGAVGKITKVEGEATIIHADGTKTQAEVGSVIMQGDIVTTGAKGAVNIVFADNTSFSISRNAKLAVDDFSYDPQEHTGTSFFSMLQGVFVYQSGDIGKEDPSKVNINTPVGSIGIRGTLVAGEINPPGQESKITIVDGAVIVTNGGGELVLNDAFETATLTGYDVTATNAGQLDSNTFSSTYASVAPVATATFNAVNSGTYQTTPTPAPAPADNTQQPAQPVPGDSDVKAQPDGTVMPPTDGTHVAPQGPAPANGTMPMAPDGMQVSPQPGVNGPAPTDGMMTTPPPPVPVQDGMMMPLPGTQPLPGTTTGALPPPTTGSTFTDGTTGTFPPTSGSGFQGTAPLPPPPGGTTTTAAPPPPPPPPSGGSGDPGTAPPPPMAQFVFAPVYLNGTPNNNADDGVPIFGIGLNFTNPVMIGQIQLQNFASAPNVTISDIGSGSYNAGTGEFTGNNLQFTYTTGGTFDTTLGSGKILEFDNQGRLFLTDPTGMITNLNNNGFFSFHVTVDDAAGNTYFDQDIVVQVKQDTGTGAITTFVGDHALGTTIIGQPSIFDNMPDTVTNGMYIGGTGTGTMGNQIQSLFGNDILVGGMGNDLMSSSGTGGSVIMYGMGGNDTLKFQMTGPLFNPGSTVDGGGGNDTLYLGLPTGGATFDFVASNQKIFDIEKIAIERGASANQVRLETRDVFEMGGTTHVLKIGAAGTSGTAQVDLYNTNTSTTDDFRLRADLDNGPNTVTYTGIHNNQTVTLIIETPNLTVTVTP